MGLLGAFTTRSDGQTITAAIWNNDFTQVRDWANTYAVLKDVTATITAVHTFSAVPVFSSGFTSNAASTVSGVLTVSGTTARVIWSETDQGSDEKKWDILVSAKSLIARTINDADNASATWLTVARGSGTAIASVTFGVPTVVGSTLTLTGALGGTSAVFSGEVQGNTLVGTLTTAAQTNITSVGTLTSLAVSGSVTPGSIAGNVSFSGTPTFGSLSASGTATIGTAAITTLSGNPNFSGTPTFASYSASGTASLTTLAVSGAATFDGNVTFGNATTDTVTVNADTITLNSQPVIVAGDNAGGNIFRLQNATASGTYLAITDPNGDGLTSVKISIGGTFPVGGADILLGQVSKNTTDTTGFPFLPYVAGAPTGVPTNGTGALVVDTSNIRLYVRVGASWRYATLT